MKRRYQRTAPIKPKPSTKGWPYTPKGNCLNCQRGNRTHSLALCNHCEQWLGSSMVGEGVELNVQWGEAV